MCLPNRLSSAKPWTEAAGGPQTVSIAITPAAVFEIGM
jgi:hypothetical protein